MQSIFLVFLGGGIGAALRHLMNMAVSRVMGADFPWHTLAINVTGSFVMGLFAAWLALRAGESWSQPMRLFLTTGICGGYTTFSAFSLDTMLLYERSATGQAAAYVVASVAGSILALAAGLMLVRGLA